MNISDERAHLCQPNLTFCPLTVPEGSSYASSYREYPLTWLPLSLIWKTCQLVNSANNWPFIGLRDKGSSSGSNSHLRECRESLYSFLQQAFLGTSIFSALGMISAFREPEAWWKRQSIKQGILVKGRKCCLGGHAGRSPAGWRKGYHWPKGEMKLSCALSRDCPG